MKDYADKENLERKSQFEEDERLRQEESDDEYESDDDEDSLSGKGKAKSAISAPTAPIAIESNAELSESGRKIIVNALSKYLRGQMPFLPEEAIEAVVESLTQIEILSEVGFYIGTKDLIFATTYPPTREDYARTFEAVVAALAAKNNEARAEKFVIDFVATQLQGRDMDEIIAFRDPMRVLRQVVENEGHNGNDLTSRMLWTTGKATMLACYHIGLYVDGKLLGEAPGESPEIAEEMAARQALKNVFRIDEATMRPLVYDVHKVKMKVEPNLRIDEWTSEKAALEAQKAIKMEL